MLNFFLQKLQRFTELSVEDCDLLRSRIDRIERFPAHVDIVQDGSEPRYVNIILEGWACRNRQLEDGRRQILSFLVSGDMSDFCVFLLSRTSHALTTVTPTTVARVSEKDMLELMQASAGLTKAFWLESLVSADIQREWTVSLGRRTAIERMAHLFSEMLLRLRAVGLANGSECELPITQADLGDALGLSSVHVNRTLQDIRSMKLVELRSRRLVVHDERALQALALFSPNYLHLQRSPRQGRS